MKVLVNVHTITTDLLKEVHVDKLTLFTILLSIAVMLFLFGSVTQKQLKKTVANMPSFLLCRSHCLRLQNYFPKPYKKTDLCEHMSVFKLYICSDACVVCLDVYTVRPCADDYAARAIL